MKNEDLLHGDLTQLESIKLLDWRLEKSSVATAVVYQLAEGEQAEAKLLERLQLHTPGLLILSRSPKTKLSAEYWVVKQGAWATVTSQLCDRFYPLPPQLKLLAVTGTNGKTTTTDLVLQLGEAAGLRGFSLGTLGVRSAGKTLEEFGLTTPGAVQLRQLLHSYGRDRDFVVMEVSSHALDQKRVHGLRFEAAAWTSFTQDHLDYHKTMDAYFQAKAQLLGYLAPTAKLAVPGSQGELVSKLSKFEQVRILPELTETQKSELPIFFRTRFNEENLACALAMVSALGVSAASTNLKRLQPPPGRFYIQEWEGRTAVVDFAHTPDALENILRALKETFPQKKIIALFGCGGDRDRTKRPQMGKIAALWADEIIVTSDNPRTENPEQIIRDILAGVGHHPRVVSEVDRPKAVREALEKLQANDVLLLAGKGHEDYIIKGTVKVPYSDIAELDGHIARLKGTSHG